MARNSTAGFVVMSVVTNVSGIFNELELNPEDLISLWLCVGLQRYSIPLTLNTKAFKF